MAHKNKPFKAVSIDNIYRLDGRVPIAKAIPFGLQHVLAMFVSNLAPITIIAAAAQPALSTEQVGMLLQNAMFIAGIATMIQLYPIWRIGSRLPIVMGVSFTFVTILCSIASNYGYPTMLGAVLIGGLMEGTLGLFARHLVHYIKPIVSASVVTGIGLSLFTVGTRSFGGGYADDFGSAKNLIIGTVTLAVCLTVVCPCRSDRRLCPLHLPRKGRPQHHSVGRYHIAAAPPDVQTRVQYRSDPVGVRDLPGVGSRDHRRYLSYGVRRSWPNDHAG